MKIEVGKRYLTQDGRLAFIQCDYDGQFQVASNSNRRNGPDSWWVLGKGEALTSDRGCDLVADIDGWHPIESAPENTPILVYVTNSYGFKFACKAEYSTQFTQEYDGQDTEWADWHEGSGSYFCPAGWYEIIHSCDEYAAWMLECPPTHWQPLPSAPEDGQHG